ITETLRTKVSRMNPQRKEGKVAKAIETETSRLPSDVFLWGAGGVALSALILKLFKREHEALLIGQWTAPLLILGLYNKVVKQQGHDQADPLPD
ncbi:MAG TPA: hypothetical protein VFM90_06275, partial [Cyclobacteriaceae bacterium]|nr:hypothetical protein [Cyclobacteriaceae bacterium]